MTTNANFPDDQASKLADLERRIKALETAPRATHTSVAEGSFDILDSSGRLLTRLDGTGVHTYDSSGVEQARFGSLTAGGYGAEVVRSGVPVSIADYIFGATYASVGTQETTSSGSVGDLATPGPSVTVTVGASGRVLVLAGADISGDSGLPTTTQAGGDVYLVYSGANTGGPFWFAGVSIYVNPAPATALQVQAGSSSARVLSGLAPGSTTFKLQYAKAAGGSANFSGRFLHVQPL